MNWRLLTAAALLPLLASNGPAWAQSAAEPRVEHRVAEDDQVRIEELRVRGETRRVVVKSKLPGVREYEVLTPGGAPDPSQRRTSAAGERVWRLFSF